MTSPPVWMGCFLCMSVPFVIFDVWNLFCCKESSGNPLSCVIIFLHLKHGREDRCFQRPMVRRPSGGNDRYGTFPAHAERPCRSDREIERFDACGDSSTVRRICRVTSRSVALFKTLPEGNFAVDIRWAESLGFFLVLLGGVD